jgi:cytochrome b
MPAGLRQAPVYDPVLRGLHWTNAVLIGGLLASGLAIQALGFEAPAGMLRHWHGIVGNALVVGLVGRVTWGMIGPPHARWRALWHPAAWRDALRSRRFFVAPTRFGHHPVASLAYLGAYTLMALLAASGLALLAIKSGHGPLRDLLAWHFAYRQPLRLVHEIAAWAMLAFVVAHLSALVLHRRLHGVPVAQSMITGIQHLPENPT